LEIVYKNVWLCALLVYKTDLWVFVSSRGDTTNTNLQNMEPVSETDEEQVPEDLGKLTKADKANTGRVSLNIAFDFNTYGMKLDIIAQKYITQQNNSLRLTGSCCVVL